MVYRKEPGIARKCVKLVGSTPSNSTLTIPNPAGTIKHCDLTGRYVSLGSYVVIRRNFVNA